MCFGEPHLLPPSSPFLPNTSIFFFPFFCSVTSNDGRRTLSYLFFFFFLSRRNRNALRRRLRPPTALPRPNRTLAGRLLPPFRERKSICLLSFFLNSVEIDTYVSSPFRSRAEAFNKRGLFFFGGNSGIFMIPSFTPIDP